MAAFWFSHSAQTITGAALLLGFMPVFFSCADSRPDVAAATALVALDFGGGVSAPEAYLDVFVQLAGGARRAESLLVRCGALSWRAEPPFVFEDAGGRAYVCALNVRPPAGEPLPAGQYAVTYEDAAGEEVHAEFSVGYDASLAALTAGDVPRALEAAGAVQEQLAVYAGGTLVYFGARTDSLSSHGKIREAYPEADAARTCYVLKDAAAVLLMPPEPLGGSDD